MAYKAVMFGTAKGIKKHKVYCKKALKSCDIDIIATVNFEDDKFIYSNDILENGKLPAFNFAIISPHQDFYQLMTRLEALGIPRDRIIDSRVFKTPNLDFPRFLKEHIAYGVLGDDFFDFDTFASDSRSIYPVVYKTADGKITIQFGMKSSIRERSVLQGKGFISLGKFCSFSSDMFFSLGENYSHNYQNVGMLPKRSTDWQFPESFWPPQGTCKILIGSDVWCGRRCTFKSVNPEKPLVIGDGAVIASDSVIVKNVPPYAIVGGNPAQIIKYRFEPHIIDALLRIKWWDWSLDKIHDNYKYWNDVEKFISLHDKFFGDQS